jgi:hypothetical protein
MVGAPVKPTGPPTPPPPPQKPRPAVPQREGSAAKRNGRPGPIIRAVISLIIVWHFTAIFLAGMSVPGPTSPLVFNIAQKRPMAWYLDALYLNQGHSFFAPDVGPGHIIRYALFDQSNRVIAEGTLPDKKEHWPRLFYHRHMMLADQVEMGGDDQQANDRMKRMILDGYARHLLRTNKDAQSARVQLFAHWPLPTSYATPDRARGYQMLQQDIAREAPNRRVDAQGFELVGEGVQRRSDLPPETNDQSSNVIPNANWQGERPNVAGRWGRGAR